jgi:DNA-binding GntR family transcriptional regulator
MQLRAAKKTGGAMRALEQEATNLGEVVYEYIKNMILEKQINCGERIPEEKIAKQLGVSRTPIREALRRLSNEGLINIYPNRFAEVITFDEKFVKELGVIRISLDTLAAQLAIHNGSNADFYKLKELADQCYEAAMKGDIANRIKTDYEFHLALSQIGGNTPLIKFQKELYLKVQLLQATKYVDVNDSLRKIEHHHQIVEKLMERDVDAVIKLIQKHLIEFYNIDINSVRTTVFDLGY